MIRNDQRGFTIVEIIIAIVVLTVGLLGLVSTAALVTRMIARGQRSSVAATFASQRMELLRPSACIDGQRTNGTDTLYRGSAWVAINNWTWVDQGNQYYRARIVTTYKTVKNSVRTDTLEVGVPCLL
ncbi:MAG TPA: prepilin-type N-terminal cleavage/methylation domain-containing protein [Gemmatimonadales bacterium]|jgi:prepilin-type N-terminal cleavage/methylation domain-containing protein|nr:prepilin-type N-terminal cleavage/methylation domain-containing protein [Gemmatimonadales bacterium]